MATLHVRNIPERLHKRIRKIAEASGRSLSAEVLTLLGQGIEQEEMRLTQKTLLENIRRRRLRRKGGAKSPRSLDLLREDRDR